MVVDTSELANDTCPKCGIPNILELEHMINFDTLICIPCNRQYVHVKGSWLVTEYDGGITHLLEILEYRANAKRI